MKNITVANKDPSTCRDSQGVALLHLLTRLVHLNINNKTMY